MARERDELTTDDKFELLIAALTAKKEDGITPDALKDILSAQATAVQKAMKPENAQHPGHSCLSYPEGDLARPRHTILSHEFVYCGYPMSKFPETEHYRELELAEQVRPGTYRVIRKDGSDMEVLVTGDQNPKGELTKVTVTFPISREEKWLVPPKAVVLYQLVHSDHPRKRFIEAMNEWLAITMGMEAEMPVPVRV